MVRIHSNAVVDKNAQLAEDVVIGPNCVIESGAEIGSGTILDANVVIGKDVRIGKGNHFFANCAIGGCPQILGLKTEVGGLIIGDDNTIREQVTVHPSMHSDKVTKIGNDNLLMVGVHIGHDCVLEDKVVMSNYSQISGHCKIEEGVWLSGMVMLHQFITLGKWCYATGLAGINHDVPPFMTVSGHYPPRVRCVNKRGMIRAGLSEPQQEKINEAYKKLYRTDGALLVKAKALAAEDSLDENVRAIVESITRSSQHQFGRYLELFRR